MFKRRKAKPILRKAADLIWPSIGIKRTMRYYWLRLVHHPASSQNLAAGFATGAALSCTPLLGLHLILAAFICFLFRLNIWSAALGTVFGNPWTFPFIWSFTYFLGNIFFSDSSKILDLHTLNWSSLIEDPWHIFIPMLVGSIPLAIFVWIASYKILSFFLDKYKKTPTKSKTNRKT